MVKQLGVISPKPIKGSPVNSSEFLYRRAYGNYCYPNGNPTSRAFKLRPKDEGELSVDVRSLTTPEKSVSDPAKFFLSEISNIDVIALNLKTIHDPLDDETNDAHSLILGLVEGDETIPLALAQMSKRVFPPFFNSLK